MKFLMKVWHPNISCQTGEICLDILKNQWSLTLTIKMALLSLQALMCSAKPRNPQNAEVAKMYMTNGGKKFDQTAKFWMETYVKATSKEDLITRVCEVVFDGDSVWKALERHGWDENAAVNALLDRL